MTSLREPQVAFIDGTLHGYPAQINSLIAASALASEARVSISNNAREGFLNALTATFPVIERLADTIGSGRPVANHAAVPVALRQSAFRRRALCRVSRRRAARHRPRVFRRCRPARMGLPGSAGCGRPSFVGFSALSGVSPDDYGSLIFRVHPAARLVESRYPVLAIWKRTRPGLPRARYRSTQAPRAFSSSVVRTTLSCVSSVPPSVPYSGIHRGAKLAKRSNTPRRRIQPPI